MPDYIVYTREIWIQPVLIRSVESKDEAHNLACAAEGIPLEEGFMYHEMCDEQFEVTEAIVNKEQKEVETVEGIIYSYVDDKE